jgi:hypothetical protein
MKPDSYLIDELFLGRDCLLAHLVLQRRFWSPPKYIVLINFDAPYPFSSVLAFYHPLQPSHCSHI